MSIFSGKLKCPSFLRKCVKNYNDGDDGYKDDNDDVDVSWTVHVKLGVLDGC